MDLIKMIVEYPSGYGCMGEVWLVYGTCLVCKEEGTGIYVDTSASEYEGALICVKCINREVENENNTVDS